MQNKFEGPFEIFIQAGQSNAEGCGLGPASDPFSPNERILYLNSDHSLTVAAERFAENTLWSDFSLFFAREFVRAGLLADGRRVLVLRCAVGGTGFLDKRWGMADDLFLQMQRMIRFAKTLHPQSHFHALLWHQGETDAILQADFETHKENLSALIDAVRAETQSPNLPFVMGDFVPHWKEQNLPICDPVVAAMREVCQSKQGAFVETFGLTSNDQAIGNGDQIHFSKESLLQLGKAYFSAYLQ